jgi:hypothetical protein
MPRHAPGSGHDKLERPLAVSIRVFNCIPKVAYPNCNDVQLPSLHRHRKLAALRAAVAPSSPRKHFRPGRAFRPGFVHHDDSVVLVGTVRNTLSLL